MRLAFAHARAGYLEFTRQPQFWVPSLAFPALFFVLFGVSAADRVVQFLPEDLGAEVVLAQFLCFSVLSIMFFQFGVGIAEDRRLPWEVTLRVLPVGGSVRFLARVLVALLFSVGALVPVVLIAALTTELRLGVEDWMVYLGAVFLGAVPFGLMGITLGYAATPKAALPIANIGFLLLSFLGGLFVPLDVLPDLVATVAPYLPSRHYLDLVQGVIGGREDGGGWRQPALLLAGWAALFLATAVFFYRRDQGIRFR